MSAIVRADVIDMTDAADEADQAQTKADKIAAKFAAYTEDIAAVATFVRANPHLAEHMTYVHPKDGQALNVFVGDAAVIALFARAGARAGREVTKDASDDYFGVKVHFGQVHLYVYGRRAVVCERVVVGTETVTHEVPDPDAPMVTVTETVETVEWRCGPLLAQDADR